MHTTTTTNTFFSVETNFFSADQKSFFSDDVILDIEPDGVIDSVFFLHYDFLVRVVSTSFVDVNLYSEKIVINFQTEIVY